MKHWKVVLAIGCGLIVAACGGGVLTPAAPLANAGAAQNVVTGTTVTLDASTSSAAAGKSLT